MGLAASQARLLTITARKADCEFQSMNLSHQKIALSRDMERISDEYQDAMNKTKLVYDFYGTGTSQMNLNYALLMTPSVYNDYYPKFLTDKLNRVVLSPEYAAAALAAGIPHEGYDGTPSSAIRNAFIECLRDQGVISVNTATNIESVPYNNAIGLGESYSVHPGTIDITYDELLNQIKAYCDNSEDYGCVLDHDWSNAKNSSNPDYDEWAKRCLTDDDGASEHNSYETLISVDGRYTGTDRTNVLTLYSLLTDEHQYTYNIDCGKAAVMPISELAFAQRQLVGDMYDNSFLNWMLDQFKAILGGVSENDMALQYAYDKVREMLYMDEEPSDWVYAADKDLGGSPGDYADKRQYDQEPYLVDGDGWNSANHNGVSSGEAAAYTLGILEKNGTIVAPASQGNHEISKLVKPDDPDKCADNYLGYVFAATTKQYTGGLFGRSHRPNGRGALAINLNNIAQLFLTAFQDYMTGVDGTYEYHKGKIVDSSLYEAKDDDIYKILAPTTVSDGDEDLVATFYDAMFNIICTNGWTENENIGNAEYMQELLKSGSVFISTMDNDAYYYQSSYSTDTYVREVQDTEAIAQAEAKYNAEKARIENKENTLDVKMKNLDTEISSLTTEYDTMKNVVSKSIEKSFKRYDA